MKSVNLLILGGLYLIQINAYGSINPKKEVKIKLAAVGDILLHCPLIDKIAKDKNSYEGILLADIKKPLKEADITFGNLEGPSACKAPLNDKIFGTPVTKINCDQNLYTGYPRFNYHPKIVQSLKNLGFDILLLSNNHALDRYWRGLNQTIEEVEKNKLLYIGVNHSEHKKKFHTISNLTVDGENIKIAWVGCTYDTNGINDKYHQVIDCYKTDTALKEIKSLKDHHSADIIIFTPHWGVEYSPCPDKKQIKLAKQAAEAGVDLILGTHPHVLQPIEEYITSDKRKVPIIYSLGNFVSGQRTLPRQLTALVHITFIKTKDSKFIVEQYRYTPLLMLNNLKRPRLIELKTENKNHKSHIDLISEALKGEKCQFAIE